MAMDWRTLSLPLTRGSDPTHDTKLLEMGKLARLDNACFVTSGSIQKDGGYSTPTMTEVAGNTTPSNFASVFRARGGVGLESSGGLHVADVAGGTAQVEEYYTRASLRCWEVAAAQSVPPVTDSAELSARRHLVTIDGTTLRLYSWVVGGRGELNPVRTGDVVATDAVSARVISDGTRVWLIYSRAPSGLGGTVTTYARTVDYSSFGLGATTSLYAATGVYVADAYYYSTAGSMYLAFYTPTVVSFGYFSVAAPAAMSLPGSTTNNGTGYGASIAVSGTSVFVAYSDSPTSGLRLRTAGLDCTTGAGETLILAKTYVEGVSLLSYASGCWVVAAYDAAAAGTFIPQNATLYARPYDSGRSALASANEWTGVVPVTKAFMLGSSPYVWTTLLDSTEAHTLLVRLSVPNGGGLTAKLSSEATVGAVFAYEGAANDVAVRATLPSVTLSYSGRYLAPLTRHVTESVNSYAAGYTVNLVGTEVSMTRTTRLGAYSDESATYLAGATPHLFDGAALFTGFQTSPRIAHTSSSGAAGITAGTRQYCAVFEVTDNAGRVWRSAPSVPITVTLGGAVSTVNITAYPIWTLSRVARFRVLLYRTEAAGVVFYQTTAANVTVTDAATVIADTTTDANLIGNSLLYTEGGVLESEPWPACEHILPHQNRLWFIGLDDPYAVQYTEEVDPVYVPATNSLYRVRFPTDLGVVCTAASVGDRLVVFCERGAWVLSGEGLDRTGANSSFVMPMKFPSIAGAARERAPSVLVSKEGVWYVSGEGTRCLGYDFQMVVDEQGRPLGSEMDAYGSTAYAIIQHPTKSQVYVYTGTDVLVWDQAFRQWSVFSGIASRSAAVVGSSVYSCLSSAFYLHGGSSRAGVGFAMVVDTGWLKLAGVQGFQRLQQALLLGTDVLGSTSETVALEVAYDYGTSFAAEATYSVPGTQGPIQARWLLARQKCTAVRLRFTTATSTNQIAFSDLAFVVGLKRGGSKLPAAQSVG